MGLKGKRIALFSVSGRPGDHPKAHEWLQSSLPHDFLQNGSVELFPFGGRKIFNKLNGGHKFILRLAAALSKDKSRKENFLGNSDFVSRKQIQLLVSWVGSE